MKLACIADVHLISETDKQKGLHKTRKMFKTAWPSFSALLDRVNEEQPDAVVFLGDVIDWFSRENVDFALDLISKLKSPWYITPGNHDKETPIVDYESQTYRVAPSPAADNYWSQCGLAWEPKRFGDDSANVLLVDSSLSYIKPEHADWIDHALSDQRTNILITHVPVNIAQVRDYIMSVDPARNLDKYVQSGTPCFYEQQLKHQVQHVFSGHLHFPGTVSLDSTMFHLLGPSISIAGHHSPSFVIADISKKDVSVQTFWLEELSFTST